MRTTLTWQWPVAAARPGPKPLPPREPMEVDVTRLAQPQGLCFNCGKGGHFVRNCPEPKKVRPQRTCAMEEMGQEEFLCVMDEQMKACNMTSKAKLTKEGQQGFSEDRQ